MRILILGVMAITAVLSANSASAEILYPWCAQYGTRGGGTNCGFSTLEQCQATVSGIGGFCRENPFYTEALARGTLTPREGTRRKKSHAAQY